MACSRCTVDNAYVGYYEILLEKIERFSDVSAYGITVCPTLMYIKLSTLTFRSSGNCCLHFSKKVLTSSPFLHYVEAGTSE